MTEQRKARTQDQRQVLPRSLEGFRDLHRGETLVVCGCGRSLSSLPEPERFVTVGVNDVGRLFDPTYLVVLNPETQFESDRFRYVRESRALALLTQLNLSVPHPHVVRFKLGRRGGTDFSDPHTLCYTHNSPYVAFCLAAHLGASRIGLIGVDFTDHHFFADTGGHALAYSFARIDREYAEVARACEVAGIEVFNLSADSRLTAFAKAAPADFAAMAPRPSRVTGSKLFVVKHNRAGGTAVARALSRAAGTLGVEHQVAPWGDRRLPRKVEKLAPDLLLVLGGREFARKWRDRFATYDSALWLFAEGDRPGAGGLPEATFDSVFADESVEASAEDGVDPDRGGWHLVAPRRAVRRAARPRVSMEGKSTGRTRAGSPGSGCGIGLDTGCLPRCPPAS